MTVMFDSPPDWDAWARRQAETKNLPADDEAVWAVAAWQMDQPAYRGYKVMPVKRATRSDVRDRRIRERIKEQMGVK